VDLACNRPVVGTSPRPYSGALGPSTVRLHRPFCAPDQRRIRGWNLTARSAAPLVALALGVGAFLVATPYISAETAGAAGIAAGVVAALVAVFGPPSWATVRAAVRATLRPRRVAAVLVLVLVGGVGHAQLFGKEAPGGPMLDPTACPDTRSMAQAVVPVGTVNGALLEVLYSRQCRLFWAQVTPTTQLRNAALRVTLGLSRDGGQPLGEVAGTITTQPLSSSPVRDEERACFAATVTVRKGDGETTVSTRCV
jgi:hypothetical protein